MVQEKPQHPWVLGDATHSKRRGRVGCHPPQEHSVGYEQYPLISASLQAQQGSQEKSIWGAIKLLIKGVRMGKIAFSCVKTEQLPPHPSRTLPTGMPSTTSMPHTHQVAAHRLLLPTLVSLSLPPRPRNAQASLPSGLWHTRHQRVPWCGVGDRN